MNWSIIKALILTALVLWCAAPAAAQDEPSNEAQNKTATETNTLSPTKTPDTTKDQPTDSDSKQQTSVTPETSVETVKPEGEQAQTATSSASGGTEEAYELKLRSLEERVNELKEKIFRTKARILQLQETVVTGSIGIGARAILMHRNEMGGAYKLISAQYSLDAQPIYKKVDVDGDLDSMDETEIFNANIVPGNHTISVLLVYQGQGYGFFSYMKGYKFKVKSSYTFTAEEGKIIQVKIVGYERGGITTSLEERPAIRYDIKIEKITPERAKTLQEKTEEPG